MEKMLEAYLAAVAAQLPQDRREDITAELRDEILSRAEMREETLGRALSEDEFEQLLRDVGHPLVVAGRYADGPQGIVGPELYPWWWFGVRMALMAVVLLAVAGVALQMLAGDLDLAQAFGRAIQQAISNGLTAIGVVTGAAWLIERQAKKPAFLSQWRVKDLGMFEWSGAWSREGAAGLFANGTVGSGPKGPAAGKGTHDGFSPVAGAAASAVFTAVVLVWWLGLLSPIRFGGVPVDGGVDYASLLKQVHALLYWPFAAILSGRIVFDMLRVVSGSPVRMTAAGDIVFCVVNVGLLVWFWVASPLAPHIQVADVSSLVVKLSSESWKSQPIAALLTAVVVFGVIGEAVRGVGAVLRFVTGKDRRQP